jgi:hypothetical protein
MLPVIIGIQLLISISSSYSLETIEVKLASTVELPCSVSQKNDSIDLGKVRMNVEENKCCNSLVHSVKK